jgi:carboxypeptidase Q
MLLAISLILAQSPSPLQKIIDESKRDNRVMAHLRELCFNIGARPTGSPECTKAEKWALAKFKSFGLDNAHLEQWGEVPVGFSRGPNNWAKLIEPFEEEIQFSTNCWMPGTEGPQMGKVVLAPKNMQEFEAATLKGAWVLSDTPSSMRGANTDREDTKLRDAINGAGILGRIYGAQGEYVHTHGSWKGKTYENRPKTVEVLIRKSDFDRLGRNIRFGRETVIEVNADNRWHKGPVAVHNVVAEIRGSEKPNEIVVVGGHIDSWNSPGSQGACDNGTGVSSTLEAARLILVSGVKPKRTIRFILWGGEEQGLLGSAGYVEKHLAEMTNISACLVDDGGSNYESGCSGIEAWRPFFEPAFNLMTQNFPQMPMKFNAVTKYNASGGSDQASFNAKGVPAFFMGKAGKQRYGHIWHTQHDRFEEAVPEYVRQIATSLAVTSMAIANADTKMPRQQ